MIVVKVFGGLGNQMFQYAFGKKLSVSKNIPLKLDIDWFKENKTSTKREFLLSKLNTHFELTSPTDLKNYFGPSLIKRLIRKINKYLPYRLRTIIYEKKFTYDKKKEKISKNTYLAGYWQSEKYFSSISNILRLEFALKSPLSVRATQYLDAISCCNSVSIHIRHGDYLINKSHEICSIEYYDKAISFIYKNVVDPHFFIFSDDIAWIKNNFSKINNSTIIELGVDTEELILMKSCKHNIIANSTFSWWGAWLNTYKDKIVIAPRKWFIDECMKTDDLIPDTWIKI